MLRGKKLWWWIQSLYKPTLPEKYDGYKQTLPGNSVRSLPHWQSSTPHMNTVEIKIRPLMMVRIVSIGSKRSVTLTSCGIGMVAPLSSSILRISKWFLENYDCLFFGLGGWQLVIDNVTKVVKMIKMTCGPRGWGEWCLPWSWQWSRPCSPRSKAATMFVFIHIWILRAYLSFNMRVLLMLQQVLCPVHILLPVRHISAKNSPKKSFYLIATSSASLGRIPFWTSMSAHIGGETITYGEGLEETINLSLSLPLTDNSQIYIWWDHQDIIDSRWHWQIIHIYLVRPSSLYREGLEETINLW